MDTMSAHIGAAIEAKPGKRFRVGVSNGAASELADDLEARLRRFEAVGEIGQYVIGPSRRRAYWPGLRRRRLPCPRSGMSDRARPRILLLHGYLATHEIWGPASRGRRRLGRVHRTGPAWAWKRPRWWPIHARSSRRSRGRGRAAGARYARNRSLYGGACRAGARRSHAWTVRVGRAPRDARLRRQGRR